MDPGDGGADRDPEGTHQGTEVVNSAADSTEGRLVRELFSEIGETALKGERTLEDYDRLVEHIERSLRLARDIRDRFIRESDQNT